MFNYTVLSEEDKPPEIQTFNLHSSGARINLLNLATLSLDNVVDGRPQSRLEFPRTTNIFNRDEYLPAVSYQHTIEDEAILTPPELSRKCTQHKHIFINVNKVEEEAVEFEVGFIWDGGAKEYFACKRD